MTCGEGSSLRQCASLKKFGCIGDLCQIVLPYLSLVVNMFVLRRSGEPLLADRPT